MLMIAFCCLQPACCRHLCSVLKSDNGDFQVRYRMHADYFATYVAVVFAGVRLAGGAGGAAFIGD
jgi:hypothetical protein